MVNGAAPQSCGDALYGSAKPEPEAEIERGRLKGTAVYERSVG
jgi:hypothetical protein